MKTLLAFALLAATAVSNGATVVNINTAQDFIQFAKNVNAGKNYDSTVYLQKDIDFTGVSGQFKSIGKQTQGNTYFSGVFDGQGHTISHLTLTNTDKYYYFGLFGISTGATIRNIIMDSTCSVIGTSVTNKSCTWDPDTLAVGGIMGYCQGYHANCLIENNIFMGKLTFSGKTPQYTNVHIGGVVGESSGYSKAATVRNCVNYGSITFTGRADSTTIGGVVGVVQGQSTSAKSQLYNCLNYGYITHTGTTSTYLNIGGVVGWNKGTAEVLDNLANAGAVSVNAKTGSRDDRIGSIIGALNKVTLTDSYWTSQGGHPAAGKVTSGSSSQCSSFNSKTLVLTSSVKVGSYSGTSLIKALNAGADSHSSLKYSKWLLNKSNHAVSFAVNGNSPFFKTSTQIILMPNLANGVSKKFSGWYTNSACTTKLTNFEISANTNLYGKFA